MSYSLNFSNKAFKSLEKIDEPYYSAIKQAIYNLTQEPRPHGYKKLTGRDGYRIRVASYRVIYNIFDKELLVDVIAIGNRKDVYE